MYMHIGGSGSVEQMAAKAKAILDKVKETRGTDPAKGQFTGRTVDNSIDIKRIDAILGIQGEMSSGVYKYTIGRPTLLLPSMAFLYQLFLVITLG
ncbi:Uncharacterised protein [Sphingobacterium multivorum]|uniref:Uncharacterized protein n=1 Tax=Sphingobacterium multivorum TaxID=28454 RepID=A0A2X2JKL2_SPHMU|nr:Uncharacterised protein [Sphingobacterium multivorum]